MKKVILFSAVGILATVVTAYSLEGNRPGRWWEKAGASAKLDLEDEQAEALDRASFDHRTREIELRASLKRKRNEVRYLLDREKIDRKAVLEASEEMAKIENEMRANRIDRRIAMRGVLTPLQREKIDEMLSRRPERAGDKGRRMKTRARKEKGRKFFRGEGAGRWWEDPRVAADISLTEEQVTELRDSSYKLEQERIGLEARKKIEEMALKRAMDAAEADRTEIDGLLGGIGEVEVALARNRAEAMISEREILSAEQLDKLREFRIEKAEERRGYFRERILGSRDRGRKGPGTRRGGCPGDEA